MDIFDRDFQKKGFAIILMACTALVGILVGYGVSRSAGVDASGLIISTSIKKTSTQINNLVTTTPLYTSTSTQTTTPRSTHTQKPTLTQRPSQTPSPTYTQTDTPTATETYPPPPPRTHTPTRTSIPPNEPPPPTATGPAPVTIESCNIDPSTVPIGISVDVTYIIQFSARIPGYGFEASVDPVYSEQSGCSGVDNDGDGMAYCVGSSGILTEPTTVYVTLTSSVGDCVVSYSSR